LSTILIIDDDDQLRKSFHKLLTEEGYTVISAASGESALTLLKEELPDLVILDLRLPGINGIETFRAIHQIEPKLPVIIMTAFGTTETAIEATKLGAFDYILKPFLNEKLVALLEKIVAKIKQALLKLDRRDSEARIILGAAHFAKIVDSHDSEFEPVKALSAKIGLRP